MSQETCETKSIRPTRYLIVKDLGCSCRAEEETLTASRPCQPISHLLLKEQFAFAAGPFHPGRCGEVCFYRSISSSSTTFFVFIWKRSCRSFQPFGFLLRRGAFLFDPRPSVNHFLDSSSKDRVARFGRSARFLRRGTFLCEPRPLDNPFL